MRGVNLSAIFVLCLAAGGAGRAQAPSLAPAPTRQLKQVAYLKASNTQANDHFGNGGTLEGHGLALSGDGTTLAVGAPYESSGAKGINGNQNDNSVYSAGAVYIFTRVVRGTGLHPASNPDRAIGSGTSFLEPGRQCWQSPHFRSKRGQEASTRPKR